MSLWMLLVLAWLAGGTLTAAQPTPPADTSGYVWAGACKDCHTNVHEAWSKTKHSTTLNRLSSADQQKDCAGCHLTGALTPILNEGKAVNAGVQCETCHGPGRAHAESAVAGTPTPMPVKPNQKLCEQCHNSNSPRFRGFFYSAMLPLVHKTK
jgi:hypothetical protein